MKSALVTGGSRGFGRAVAEELIRRGWRVVVDSRHPTDLPGAIQGDVADPVHRRQLADAGPFDLLVNNASMLGPMPALADYPLDELEKVYAVNTFAPLALIQLLKPPVVVNISSDAAVGAYEGWGGYGSSKAALDQLTAVYAAEHPGLRVYSFDPGDMNTEMHQQAFPGEDISDRATPASVVPRLMKLLDEDVPSGRYT